MTHLYRVPLQFADMFVSELDTEKSTIRYTIRDKVTGVLLEPEVNVPFFINELEQKIEFSGGRYIAIGLAGIIAHTLK